MIVPTRAPAIFGRVCDIRNALRRVFHVMGAYPTRRSLWARNAEQLKNLLFTGMTRGREDIEDEPRRGIWSGDAKRSACLSLVSCWAWLPRQVSRTSCRIVEFGTSFALVTRGSDLFPGYELLSHSLFGQLTPWHPPICRVVIGIFFVSREFEMKWRTPWIRRKDFK